MKKAILKAFKNQCTKKMATPIVALTLIFSFNALALGSLPKSLYTVGESVFRIVPLNLGDSGEASTAKQRQKHLATACKAPINFISKLRCDYMRNQCPKKGDCRIPFNTSGTGFLAENGQTLVSAFHVLGALEKLGVILTSSALVGYSPEQMKDIYQGFRPQFLVFNSGGELVYDTRDYKEPHVFESVGDPMREYERTTIEGFVPANLAGFGADFAIVKLKKSLGPGLKVKLVDQTDSILWAIGYPARTSGREFNYDGYSLAANQGERIPLPVASKLLGFKDPTEIAAASDQETLVASPAFPSPLPSSLPSPTTSASNPALMANKASATADDSLLLVTGNDIVEGFSGGPLFNERGEVVGIITASMSDETTSQGVAFGVPWQDFKPYLLH